MTMEEGSNNEDGNWSRHDAKESREILEGYRKLQDTMATGDMRNIANIHEIVQKADERVLTTDRQIEVNEDAVTISQASQAARKVILNDKISNKTVLDFPRFFQRFQQMMNEQEDLQVAVRKLGVSSRYSNTRAPTISSMFAPIMVEKKKITRKRTEQLRVDKSKQKRPGQVRGDEMHQGANQQSEIIQGILKLIRAYEQQIDEDDEDESMGIPLYQLILNPTHYNQSVENLFYLSFLVRDGHLGLAVDDGEPVVFTPKPGREKGESQSSRRNQQVILDLDMANAHKLVEAYGISAETQMIPTRLFDDNGNVTNMGDYAV